jgi:hypothetical protein
MNWKDRLKQAWNENPLQVIATGAMAVTAAALLVDAASKAKSRRAYSKQVEYRIMTGQ